MKVSEGSGMMLSALVRWDDDSGNGGLLVAIKNEGFVPSHPLFSMSIEGRGELGEIMRLDVRLLIEPELRVHVVHEVRLLQVLLSDDHRL